MKPGDLVVRTWGSQTYWKMIGIIISRKFMPKNSGGAEWIYGIMWSQRDFASNDVNNPFGTWSDKEFKVINESR